jgi:DNA-binding transcriptional ArsR family regulator
MVMNEHRLDSVFGALAHPTRRAILMTLTKGPKSVGDLSRPFKMSEPAVIKHLRVLELADLIVADRQGQIHPRLLHAAPLKEAHAWIGEFSGHWSASFDRLETLLNKLKNKEKTNERKKSKT